MKKIILAVSTILFLLSFSSINNFAQKTYNEIMYPVPECSDESVTSLISPLYKDMRKGIVESTNWTDRITVSLVLPGSVKRLEAARSAGYDEYIRRRSCEAEAVFDINDGIFSNNKKEMTATITYHVQLDEKNNQQFIVILEPDFINNLYQKASGILGLAPKNQ